jgi:NhaA family Na+:H+ antiporter
LALSKPLFLWINDGLMSFFFFVVGLELKRELLEGELSSVKKALLPALCALGGMLAPAGLYMLLNHGGAGASGWGIPMATDIAFALGVLVLLGSRAPPALKVFLTAVAIADDIGAIIVIAAFYTEDLSLVTLAIGGAMFAVALVSNAAGVRSSVFYFALGTLVWLAFLKSGVHATLAAVLMAFAIPARTRVDLDLLFGSLERSIHRLRSRTASVKGQLLPHDVQETLYDIERAIENGTAPLQRLEHALMPLVVFVVLPIFALANAGVAISFEQLSFGNPIVLGIILGLCIGKPLGICLTALAAVGLKVAALPEGLRARHLVGVGILAGIGFTMALFIGNLAFSDESLIDSAKLGVLMASLVSATAGYAVLAVRWRRAPATNGQNQ